MVWWWGGPLMAVGSCERRSARSMARWPHLVLRRARLRGRHRGSHQLGYCSLVGALILGPRKGYKQEPMRPHNLTFTLTGTGLLWVGWVGFNAGSNLESNGYAGLALLNTFVATAAALSVVGPRGSGPQEEAEPARHGVGRCCRPRRHHAGRRLRRSGGRDRPRPHRRRRSACSPARASRTCSVMTTASMSSASTAWAASSAPSAPASSLLRSTRRCWHRRLRQRRRSAPVTLSG